MKPILAVFDFDGTITRKDTLLEFIRFACGSSAFLRGFALYSPILVLMKLHLYPNWKAKQRVFTHFFGGMPEKDFSVLCERFCERCFDRLVYADAQACIRRHLEKGEQVAVVSASPENWVRLFAEKMGIHTTLGTQLEIKDGRLTGRFKSKNCYGQEKVNRILERFPKREEYTLIAYGDSNGDKQMLAFADQGYYKLFTK